MGLGVVGDVGGILGVDGGGFENKFVGVEGDCCGGGCDDEIDFKMALVGEGIPKFEAGKREVVVGWFDALDFFE